MGGAEHHREQSEAEEDRQRRWSVLPPAVEPDELTTSEPSALPPPDLVDDPGREFFIRHAG
jgi:hypothetical protein